MPDFGQCGEPTCPQTSARLFDCAHHCLKLVCLHHLIEHDRIFERNKKQAEIQQSELKRLHSIYSTLIDENKIRSEYEQKINDYRKLVSEVTCVLENNHNDVEQLRMLSDKLKKMINDKQKQTDDSLTIVKVEPIDESVSSTTNTPNTPRAKNAAQNVVEDASIYIGFDRLQNLVIDTDYHRRKASEAAAAAAAAAAAVKYKIESKPIKEDDDEDDDHELTPDPPHPRIAGTCPLWLNGAYGLTQAHHSVRLCRKKHYSDLSNHIRQFHGLFTPVANVIARAVQVRIPTTKCLIPTDLQVADARRSFLCPLRSECGNQCWLPAICLKSHLMELHRMSASTADLKIKTIRKLNRNKPMSKIRSKITEIAEQIESARK